jgi:hypothetical protein
MGALAYETECKVVVIEKRDGCGRLKKDKSESNNESFGSAVPLTTEHDGISVFQVDSVLPADDRDAHQMSFRMFAIGRGAAGLTPGSVRSLVPVPFGAQSVMTCLSLICILSHVGACPYVENPIQMKLVIRESCCLRTRTPRKSHSILAEQLFRLSSDL